MSARLIRDMSAKAYHTDPCPAPSLSSSVVRALLEESPLHVWSQHPRLGGADYQEPAKKHFELGSAIHKLTLGRGAEIEIIKAADYRTSAAKQARDDAIKAGKIAVLANDYELAELAAGTARPALEDYMGAPITDCLTECVILWQEQDRYWRRAMLDVLSPDFLKVADIKSTAMSVAPAEATRRLYSSGYHLQAAFYLRGLDALQPGHLPERRFGFLHVQTEPPFDCAPPMEISTLGFEIAHSDVQRACEIWDECIDNGRWPGHWTSTPHVAEPPGWMVARYENSLEVSNLD